MAIQDLTPQLRTRLSRMERAVGWFVLLATLLLVTGFVYYVYSTAERKGWFLTKVPYFTFTDRATGLKVGDPVTLMGFDAGEITKIEPMAAEQFDYNVYIEFVLKAPNYDYMWTVGSKAKVATADFLGKRVVEVTKGIGGYPIYVFNPMRELPLDSLKSLPDWESWLTAEDIYDSSGTNLVVHALRPLSTNLTTIASSGRSTLRVLDPQKGKYITAIWQDFEGRYAPYTNKPYWLKSDESAAVTERLEKLVGDVEKALPNILNLTNQITAVLTNSSQLASNLNEVVQQARPVVSNLVAATAGLDQPGALGARLLPPDVNQQLGPTLTDARHTLTSVNTNLAGLAENLARSLDNLASITSNLNNQVQANTNMLSAISSTVIHADEFVQGLKHHWLLRSAFKPIPTNAPPSKPSTPALSPKDKSLR